MKPFRLVAAGVALAVVSVVSASAQASRPAAPAQPAPSSASPALAGKLAVIDSSAFGDEKAGITRVVNAMKNINAQFQPQQTELQNMQTRYQALLDQIQKTAPVAQPAATQALQDQAEDLKRQIERKVQDAQAAVDKRQREVLGPLQDDVYNALQAYASARGIAVVIDLNRVPVLYAADSVDITKDFITEYNRTHPATTAAAAPGTGRP
ncbi:MAG: OmpH family outer membrane protein [Acidobacteria bacterium]|nr:OmpH family outer membrane protein [Acidobacteriota bacterium]